MDSRIKVSVGPIFNTKVRKYFSFMHFRLALGPYFLSWVADFRLALGPFLQKWVPSAHRLVWENFHIFFTENFDRGV